MDVTIGKSKATGSITAPPSKSIAHRYIICASLAEGTSVISNIDLSEDIKATIDCVKALGAEVSIDGDVVTINGINEDKISDRLEFMCRESGSTMRFFMGIAMYYGRPSRFFGSETLRNRPFGIYEKICEDQGIVFKRLEDSIYLEGALLPGEFVIEGNVSSQFITGLMYILPLLSADSVIRLIPPVESRSYIDLTIQAMKAFGVTANWTGENDLTLAGGQRYVPNSLAVEGDCSNAAFLESLNVIGGNVTINGMNPDSIQGDRVYEELFEQLKNGHATIDISDCPDLGPILFAVAAALKGGIFTGTRRLKIKESDRGTVMCAELRKFGINSRIEENEIEIYEGKLCKPEVILDGHNDHRIVMSEAVLSSVTGGSIEGAQAVRKSYPDFFEDIKSLGIEVSINGMD